MSKLFGTVTTDSIYTAIIGKIVPYMGSIRDTKGNVVCEHPLVRIDEVRRHDNGFNFLAATWANGPKVGERCYLDLTDVIAF